MPGIVKQRKVQFGTESTAGTAVAATTIWRGPGATWEDTQETVFPDENVGYLSGLTRVYVPKVEAALAIPETEATYEQLPYLFETGIATEVATQDGTGTGYIYAYVAPTTAANTTSTLTIEGGDNTQAERAAYCFPTAFTLSGVPGEAVKMSADFVGRQLGLVSYTGALSVPSVEEILFQRGTIAIDAVSGTIGATVKSATWLGFTLNVDTGLRQVYTGDDQLYYNFVKQIGPEITLEVTLEHDATALAEKAAWRAKTPRQIRMKFEGSTFGTAGTVYSKKTLIIDVAGVWESFGPLDDSDGNDTVTGVLRCRYDPTAALFAEFIVVNSLTALP